MYLTYANAVSFRYMWNILFIWFFNYVRSVYLHKCSVGVCKEHMIYFKGKSPRDSTAHTKMLPYRTSSTLFRRENEFNYELNARKKREQNNKKKNSNNNLNHKLWGRQESKRRLNKLTVGVPWNIVNDRSTFQDYSICLCHFKRAETRMNCAIVC